MIRPMTIEDYGEVFKLWKHISGFGIRNVDDSREGIRCFLKRNPTTSVVAIEDNRIVGSILCGHDGRRGCFYHVCVEEGYRKRGIATKMVKEAIEALRKEEITVVHLVAFRDNKEGNSCWKELGWTERQDLNYYEMILDKDNVTFFNC